MASIPFAYRYVRTQRISLFLDSKSQISIDKNYINAEKIRVIQVLLGAIFFFIHGTLFWGFINIVIFLFVTIIISLLAEIIGSKTGYIFGGKYQYHKDNTPGYLIYGVPVLIPIAWFGIIYMCINFCYHITKINFPYDINFNSYFIILTSIFVVLLDLVLDPIAVDEKRWEWQSPGSYYGVPILNFFGWMVVPFVVLFFFQKLCQPIITNISSYSFFFQYAPGLLFISLPVIASRPCFERGLTIPGYIGISTFIIYLTIAITKY
tara:strand:- start:59 stop:850 length:792 start_codon:yes stop_codon:yes gene_type:complete